MGSTDWSLFANLTICSSTFESFQLTLSDVGSIGSSKEYDLCRDLELEQSVFHTALFLRSSQDKTSFFDRGILLRLIYSNESIQISDLKLRKMLIATIWETLGDELVNETDLTVLASSRQVRVLFALPI